MNNDVAVNSKCEKHLRSSQVLDLPSSSPGVMCGPFGHDEECSTTHLEFLSRERLFYDINPFYTIPQKAQV